MTEISSDRQLPQGKIIMSIADPLLARECMQVSGPSLRDPQKIDRSSDIIGTPILLPFYLGEEPQRSL